MAEQTNATAEERAAQAIARAGLITSITGAAIMLAVLAGNLFIISLRHVPPNWLTIMVQVGPPFVALLGFVGTGSTWYARWRVIRRHARYEVRDDLTDQALSAPGAAQDLPGQLGCATVVNPLVLALGLLLCLATFGPAPLGLLGAARNGANQPAATPTAPVGMVTVPTLVPTSAPTATIAPSPTAEVGATAVPTTEPPTATPQPAPTNTPIPPPMLAFTVKPLSGSTRCVGGTAGALLTLDNTGSTIAVGWRLSDISAWARPAPASGIVPAGKTTQLTLTITNCTSIPAGKYADERGAVILTSGGTGTIAFTVHIRG